MHFLLRSPEKRPRARVREGLSDRIDRVRPARRFARASNPARARATPTRLQRHTTLRSNGDVCARHSRVLFDSWRTGSVRTTAEAAGAHNLFEVSLDFGVRDCNRINHRHPLGIRVFLMTTDSPSEKRLEQLREQAWGDGVVAGRGVDVAGGPIPRK